MSSTKFYLFLLLTLLSITTFCDGWKDGCDKFFCSYCSKDHWMNTCKCKNYVYKECPAKCDIDDCKKPLFFSCNDYRSEPRSKVPKKCRCEDFKQSNCPDDCEKWDCSGYFAWYWYLIIGIIILIVVAICIGICICLSMRSRKKNNNNKPPQQA